MEFMGTERYTGRGHMLVMWIWHSDRALREGLWCVRAALQQGKVAARTEEARGK